MSYSRFVGERDWNYTFKDSTRWIVATPTLEFVVQIEGCPPEHRSSCAHLSAHIFFAIGIDLNYII